MLCLCTNLQRILIATSHFPFPVTTCVPPFDSLDVGSGVVTLASGQANLYGSTYTIVCPEGYQLTGDASFECGADGQWTISGTTCTGRAVGIPALEWVLLFLKGRRGGSRGKGVLGAMTPPPLLGDPQTS